MKLTAAVTTCTSLLSLALTSQAFAPHSKLNVPRTIICITMDLEMPSTVPTESIVAPATATAPVRMGGGSIDVRYSEFLKMVNSDRVEKVTFSADGTKLLGVDVDGTRLQIESLPNDPDLLTQLTLHKVNVY